VLLRIRTPASNDRGPLYAEYVFAALHQANARRLPLRLMFGIHAGNVGIFIAGQNVLRSLVEEQLYANYPDCSIDLLPDDALEFPGDAETWSSDLLLVPDLFPCRRYAQFEDAINRVTADPLMGILTTLAHLERDGFRGRLELVVCPAGRRRPAQARRCLRRLDHPFFRSKPRLSRFYAKAAMSPQRWRRIFARFISLPARHAGERSDHNMLNVSASRLHDREEDLQAASDKLGRLLFEARLRVSVSAPASRRDETRQRLQELAGSLGHFSSPRTAAFRIGRPARSRRPGPTQLLSCEEVASLFHPPSQSVRAQTLARVDSREFEPPPHLAANAVRSDAVQFARTQFRSQQELVGLTTDDRRRHVAIIGKTGTGKTTLLQNLLVADIRAGHGVACIEPHGDLADSLLALVPRNRTNDVVLFDVGDTAHPLSFNLLACDDKNRRPLVASGIVSSFKKIYGTMWGPRLEHILRNALLALLEIPGSSLVQILPLLGDDDYRQKIIKQVQDPAVRRFWEREFAQMPARLRGEAVSPVLNKIGHLVTSPVLRNIVGQAESTLDLRQIMDEGRILIVNLSKGRVGDDASELLGALLVTALQLAAMSRADVREEERRDFFAYIDEFSNFTTDAFASTFSEARKYRLALTVATQFLEQLDDDTRASMFGNVGTTIAFQVSQRDAEIMAEELGGGLLPADLLTLPRFQAYVRMLVDGQPTTPFSVRTLPPSTLQGDEQATDVLRRTSRHRYTTPVKQVDRQLAAALVSA
jgi:hypothetical protein